MDPVTVSVIIPAHNAGRTIEETLQSVFAQTWRGFEVIVVNDGSTDATARVLAPHIAAGRIVYLETANGGPSGARNCGIARARGEFIAFLDADDLWLPDKLEKQLRRFEQTPQIGLVYTDMVNFSRNGEGATTLFQQKQPVAGRILDRLFFGNFILTSTVLVRKAALHAVGGFDPNLWVNEDIELFLRLAEQIEFDFINEVLVRRRLRQGSLIHTCGEQIHLQDLALIDTWCRRRPDLFRPDDPAIRKRKALIHARLGEACWHGFRFGPARQEFYSALRGGIRNRRLMLMLLLSYFPPSVRLLKWANRNRRRKAAQEKFT